MKSIARFVLLFAALSAVGPLDRTAPPAADAAEKAAKPVPARPSGGSGGKHGTFSEESIEVGGVTRTYRLIVPESVDLTKPAPLVFAFHGFLLDSADFMARYSKLPELAQKEKFILVFPQGLERRWEILAKPNRDIAYFDALLARLLDKYDVDRNRVYATGMSNGAYFSNLLASQRSDVLAAIAPHSGGPGVLALTGVKAKRKIPVLVLHGTLDGIVPPREGRNTRDLYQKEGHPVELVEIDGLRHFWGTWHGSNTKIWEFFKDHPLDPPE